MAYSINLPAHGLDSLLGYLCEKHITMNPIDAPWDIKFTADKRETLLDMINDHFGIPDEEMQDVLDSIEWDYPPYRELRQMRFKRAWPEGYGDPAPAPDCVGFEAFDDASGYSETAQSEILSLEVGEEWTGGGPFEVHYVERVA